MKTCSKCGAQNGDDAAFCSKCGSAITNVQAETTVDVVAAPAESAAQPAQPNPGMLWLWLNIALTVLCCGGIVSIVGIVFGGISVSKYNKGLHDEARSNANISKWLFIVSLILGVVSIVVSIFTGMFALIPLIFAAVSNGDFSQIPNFN